MKKIFYLKCDRLEKLPRANKNNWLFELNFIIKKIPKNSKVLQIGCMDGTRMVAILKRRRDLELVGLDVDDDLVKLARINLRKAGIKAKVITGDATKRLPTTGFDYILCLNNTLGYIPQEGKAMRNMKKAGQRVIISVYGEKFTDGLAKKYFDLMGLKISTIRHGRFITNIGTIKRYSKSRVKSWGGKIIRTPIGYLTIIK